MGKTFFELGKEEGILESIETLLDVKFGEDGLLLLPKIREIKSLEKLRKVVTAIREVKSIKELEARLN